MKHETYHNKVNLFFIVFLTSLLVINLAFKDVLGDNINQTLIFGIMAFGVCYLIKRQKSKLIKK